METIDEIMHNNDRKTWDFVEQTISSWGYGLIRRCSCIAKQPDNMRRIHQFIGTELLKRNANIPNAVIRIILRIILEQEPSIFFYASDKLFHLHVDEAAFCP
ncbi:hypothetical protein D3C84_1052670 [compost metagenome]